MYEVIVGNVGAVYRGENATKANEKFASYVELSKNGAGRAGGESVTMMLDGEIVKEHIGLVDGGE